MMIFCYLYITNDDIFVKRISVLICKVHITNLIVLSLKNIIYFIICNVLFAKFIKTPNFCTLLVLCAILFLHTYRRMCNFVATIVIFAHVMSCVQFCFCTHITQCAIFPNR